MNIILTSKQHVGKTTACKKLVETLRLNDIPVGGILCVGDDIEELDGKHSRMAFLRRTPGKDSLRVGPYYISHEAIRFGEAAISRSKGVTIIDEYGMIEWRKEGFHDVTVQVLKNKICVVLVREFLLNKFIQRFGKDFKIFYMDEKNRDTLPSSMFDFISSISSF